MPPVLGIASGGNFFLDSIPKFAGSWNACVRFYEQIVSSAYLTMGNPLSQKLGAGMLLQRAIDRAMCK